MELEAVVQVLKLLADAVAKAPDALWLKVVALLLVPASYLGASAGAARRARKEWTQLLHPYAERISALEEVSERRCREEGRDPSLLTIVATAQARRAET
jgi:hypothetical protein